MRRFIKVMAREDSAHPELFAAADHKFSVEGDFGFQASFKEFEFAFKFAEARRDEFERDEPRFRVFIETGPTVGAS